MANLKNWLPEMTDEQRAWFDKCPKAVLFEISIQFGMRVADDFTAEGGFKAVKDEWQTLYDNGIVPQKPATIKPVKIHPEIAAARARQEGNT